MLPCSSRLPARQPSSELVVFHHRSVLRRALRELGVEFDAEGLRIGAQPRGIDQATGPRDDADGANAADEVARMIEEAKGAPIAQR